MTARFETISTLNQTCQSCGGTMQIELSETECGLLIDVLGDVCALWKRECGRSSRRVGEPLAKESRHVCATRHNLMTAVLDRLKSAKASARMRRVKNAHPA